MESPELTELLVDQVHGVHTTASKDEVRRDTRSVLGALRRMLDEDLPAKSRHALHSMSIAHDDWSAINQTLRARHHPKVQQLGLQTLRIIEKHGSSGPAAVEGAMRRHLMENLPQLSILKAKLIPERISHLYRRWMLNKFGNETATGPTPGLWRGMLEPTALTRMQHARRRQENEQAQPSSEAHARLLQFVNMTLSIKEKGGAGDHFLQPDLTGPQIGVSVISVLLVLAVEVLLHLEIFARHTEGYDFYLPWWAWLILIGPTQAFSIATCSFGLSGFCKFELSVLGLHQIEAVIGFIYVFR